MMSEIRHLVEASLYIDDLDRAEQFYTGLLGLELIAREDDRHLFYRVGESVLLLFLPEATLKGETLPVHGAHGPGHVALGIGRNDIEHWRQKLESNGVEIEKTVDWPAGGRSLYFRDPAGNSLELLSPTCWELPSGW